MQLDVKGDEITIGTLTEKVRLSVKQAERITEMREDSQLLFPDGTEVWNGGGTYFVMDDDMTSSVNFDEADLELAIKEAKNEA